MFLTHPGALMAFGLSFVAVGAQAQCVTVDPTIVPQVRVDPLDATGSSELAQPFVLTFRRASTDQGPLQVRFQIVDEDSTALARVGLSRGPLVEWTGAESARDLGALRHEAYALLRTGRVVFGETDQAAQQQVILRLSDLRADLPAGVYREQFTVRYWCDKAETDAPFESAGAVAASVAVPNVLSANIAGATARGEVDFVNFEAARRSVRVSVRSTGPFRVSARSANGGILLRDGGQASQPSDRIRYEADFDGAPIRLDGSAMPVRERAGLAGRQIALDLTVGDVGANRAGVYKDTIVLVLEPAN